MTDVSTETLDDPSSNPEGALLPLLSAVLLVGIGLVSVIDAVTVGGSVEHIEEVPAEVGDSTVVLVAPGREEQLEVLSQGRMALLAPPWEPLPDLERDYWVVLGDGVELPRLPEGYEVRGEREDEAWTWVQIAVAEPSARADRWDLLDSLRGAEVAYEDDDGTRHPCDQWRFGRWTCGLDEWLWIGVAEPTFRGQTRSCVWAHPRADSTLVIRSQGVPVGERLRGRYGIADSGAEMVDGAPVDFAVRVGRAERSFVAQNRQGMSSYRVRLDPDDVDGAATDVEFRVSSEFVGRRHFCFTAAMQGTGPSDDDAEDLEEILDHVPDPTNLAPAEGSGLGMVDAAEGEGGAEGSGEGTGGGQGAIRLPSRRLDLPARRLQTSPFEGRRPGILRRDDP